MSFTGNQNIVSKRVEKIQDLDISNVLFSEVIDPDNINSIKLTELFQKYGNTIYDLSILHSFTSNAPGSPIDLYYSIRTIEVEGDVADTAVIEFAAQATAGVVVHGADLIRVDHTNGRTIFTVATIHTLSNPA